MCMDANRGKLCTNERYISRSAELTPSAGRSSRVEDHGQDAVDADGRVGAGVQ